jgi:hypothetical protein
MARIVMLLATAAAIVAAPAAQGQTHFTAELHPVPGAHGHDDAGGHASLMLSADHKQLHYIITLSGLDLEPNASQRFDANDVFGIHMHLIVPGQIGPHVLNIFGDPAEEDADLVVNYNAETLSGVFDASDATRDPLTGELLPQFFPLTTKVIDDWIDYLLADGLYLAVHTVGQGGGALLHGDILRVPEPGTASMALAASALLARRRRWLIASSAPVASRASGVQVFDQSEPAG